MRALHDYAASGEFAQGGALEDEECNESTPCAAGLVCAGYTVYPMGYYRPEWMAGTFESTTDVAIPDASATGIESSIQVSGLASVPEDLIINLDIAHPRLADLEVVLVGPSGEETIWAAGSTGPKRVIVGPGIERDAAVNGTWTLVVVDTKDGSVGTLKGWSLELTSRMD
jgi:serine protease